MENKTGWIPVEYKLLVLPDKVEEMTEGGIIIPEQVREKEEVGVTEGVLIAASDMCFEDWKCEKPVIGSKIMFSRYAGKLFIGDDEEEYRVMKDQDIIAFRRKE
jgi:co-chaperonin GroES (HSP10)